MTPVNPRKQDTWLLLFIAALVVCGAVGITMLAGLSEEADVASIATRNEVERVLPAVNTVELPQLLTDRDDPWKTPGSTIGPDSEESVARDAEPESPAFEIDPDVDPYVAGQRAFAAREFGLAAAYFEADSAARPDAAYSQYMLGLAAWKSGENERAVAALSRSAELNDRSIRTWINLSRVENERGTFDDALAAAEKAIEIDAEDPTALYVKGRSLRNLGRTEEATLALEACLEQDAGQGNAHNLLGLIHLARGEGSAAIAAFQQAAAALDGVAYVHNNLGQALEVELRWADAALAYRRALELDALHPAATLALARVEPRVPTVVAPEILVAEGIEPELPQSVVPSEDEGGVTP